MSMCFVAGDYRVVIVQDPKASGVYYRATITDKKQGRESAQTQPYRLQGDAMDAASRLISIPITQWQEEQQ